VVGDAGAGKVHGGVDAGQPGGVDGACLRVPPDRARPATVAPHDSHDAVAGGGEGSRQRRADEPTRSGDGDLHAGINRRGRAPR
jgi:hypothetical protein